MRELFLKIMNMGLSASVVILAVLALRLPLRRTPKKWSYLLWTVVGFRLCCPVSLPAVFSIFRALPVRPAVAPVGQGSAIPRVLAPATTIRYLPQNIGLMARPQVNVGVPAVNEAINSSLPAATPAGSVNPMQVWLLAAAVIWCLGMAALVAVSLLRYFKTRRLVLDAVRVEEGVYETDANDSPFILGFLRPVIYLPLGLEGERRRYVLEHERYHLKRKDHLARLFAFLLLAVHWFNPLVWLAYHLMGKDMEMSCDEKVLGMEEDGQRAYSNTLLSFAVAGQFPGLLAFGEASVKSRIKNVLNWQRPKTWVSLLAALAVLVTMAACAVNPTTESSPTLSEEQSIPTLEEACTMTAEALEVCLSGHTQAEVRAAWGEPQAMYSGMYGDIWESGEDTIGVYYDFGTKQVENVIHEKIPAVLDLPIPAEYADLLEVEQTSSRVSVYERQSREDFRADFARDPWPEYASADQVGMGWLCTISRVSEAEAVDQLDHIDGVEPIARDENGNYYLLYFPTDMRLYRTGGTFPEENVGLPHPVLFLPGRGHAICQREVIPVNDNTTRPPSSRKAAGLCVRSVFTAPRRP